jgi:anti-sigma factor RsiW
MNCDQAFEVMTDPCFEDGAALDEHLEICPRCRQMYETLSPALGLFREARPDSPAGFDACTVAAPVEVTDRSVAGRARRANPALLRRSLRLVSSSMILGVAIGAVAVGLAPALSPSPSGAVHQPAECTWIHREAVPDGTSSPQSVVLSCMACHFSPTVE